MGWRKKEKTMIHARKDYDRIQDPALGDPSLLGEGCSPIGEDEPVFLLRAKDKNFQLMLQRYMQLLAVDPEFDVETMNSVSRQVVRATAWQKANGTKSPDAPEGSTR
jgi:hypothetical protein